VIDAKRIRRAETDATGVAEAVGFYPGRHEIRGHLPGERGRTHFVRIRDEDRLVLDLDEGDVVDLEARVLRAGAVSGQLLCDDGEPAPAAASFRVLPASWERSDSDDALNDGAVVSLEGEPLTGSGPDEFLLGPLEDGLFLVAARPAGFDRWTWFGETEEAERASLVEAVTGEVTEVYVVRVLCAPRVEIRPSPSDRSALPDLRKATVEIRALVPAEDGEESVRGVRVEQKVEHVVVHGLSAGEVRLEVAIRHPMFLPDGVLEFAHTFEAERGAVEEVRPGLPGIGGVVEWRGDVASARLVRPESEPRLQSPTDGLLRWEAVPAGEYALEICADRECSRVMGRIHPVRVEAGELTRVRD
jgi:hypothetical protein